MQAQGKKEEDALAAAARSFEEEFKADLDAVKAGGCLLYTSPSPRDGLLSRMPSSA